MTRRTAVVVLVGLFAFLSAGCAPTPAGARAALETRATAIDTAAQDLLAALEDAGLEGASAGSTVEVCQSQPVPGVSYQAGISVTIGDDLAGGYDALVEQLDATGWQPTDAYRDVKIDPDKPMGRFAREDITLDVKTGGFSVGETKYGTDAMALGITIKDECVRIPDGTSFIDFKDLEKKFQPRG